MSLPSHGHVVMSHASLAPSPLPAQIRDKYQLHLPAYPGASQCVRIGGSGRSPAAGPANVADLRVSYGAAGQSLDEADVSAADAWGHEGAAHRAAGLASRRVRHSQHELDGIAARVRFIHDARRVAAALPPHLLIAPLLNALHTRMLPSPADVGGWAAGGV